ncbi:MAG TPA: Fur family transcriptional regulator [Rhodopila sp.]
MTEFEALCQQRGVRLTEKRRIICRAFAASGDHPDVEQIFERALALDPKISRGTVYRTMNTLQQAGLLSQRWFGERRARYEEARIEHHHLIDIASGRVLEFRSQEVEALNQRIARELGYRLTGLRVELYGVRDADASEDEAAEDEAAEEAAASPRSALSSDADNGPDPAAHQQRALMSRFEGSSCHGSTPKPPDRQGH